MHLELTEALARKLADLDKYYRPVLRRGEWIVWDEQSDHVVEFDERTIERARQDIITHVRETLGARLKKS